MSDRAHLKGTLVNDYTEFVSSEYFLLEKPIVKKEQTVGCEN